MSKPLHSQSYPRFLLRCLLSSLEGNGYYYAWMGGLFLVMLVGLDAFSRQTAEGMGVTAMSDHVSWGIYIANLTYFVGLAAGGVMMVIPAYLYKDHEMHKVVLAGEFLAIAAIVVALGFVAVDIGRPDRFWHIIPGIGRFNWPMSMLTWDVIVLSGYLLFNLHIAGYLLYTRFIGVRPTARFYVPVVLMSIVWAVSIHTVTAFLYSGLGGRPFWNTAILAPRFIASAFVTGPAFILVALQIVRRVTSFDMGDGPLRTLLAIMRVTAIVNLFLMLSEVFTLFYTGGAHAAGAIYLYRGLDGHDALVPWIWSSIALNVTSAIIFVFSSVRRNRFRVNVGCAFALAGIWIEKGMGLIVPGFVPSTLHEIVEYVPNLVEWKVSVGIWALGLMIYTIGAKLSVAVYSGAEQLSSTSNTAPEDNDTSAETTTP
ncbi:MAG: sulfate reduction electron transfer complex DsrMKJOP subunit DsrP [Nannocystales bacterium]